MTINKPLCSLKPMVSTSLKPMVSTAVKRILEVKFSELQPNPFQPRKDFDPDALQELADSIRASGLIQPIAVTESDEDGYSIVAGERRCRALKLLKRETVWPLRASMACVMRDNSSG